MSNSVGSLEGEGVALSDKGKYDTPKKDASASLEVDTSATHDRAPILSPRQSHRDYNRLKYYSALKTGFKHMGTDQDLLTPPVHVIDQNLFLLQIPFARPSK